MTFFVGVSGPIGAGKDFFASNLKERLNLCESFNLRFSAHIISLAGPIRKAAKEICLWDEGNVTDRVLKEQACPYWGFSPRVFMQKLGTEFAREMFDQDFWLKRLFYEAQIIRVPENVTKVIIVPDVRFDNEAEKLVYNTGGFLVKITIPEEELNSSIEKGNKHASENGVDEKYTTHTIHNDYTNNFLNGVDLVYSDIKEKFL